MLPIRAWIILPFLFAGQLSADDGAPISDSRLPDTLAICPVEFQPALQQWVDYRTSQGHVVRVESPAPTSQGIKIQIRRLATGGNLESVFLVGDCCNDQAVASRIVPTDYVAAKVNVLFGADPEIATDNTFADLDDDGVPDLGIGRLPADSAAEVRNFTRRVIKYETNGNRNDGSVDPTSWRRKINFVAGVGGFGGTIDNVLEQTTKQIITDLIPMSYSTSMTFGSWRSPYCPDPRRFSETAIGRFNEGCLFWVYIGHGSCHQLDRIRLPNQSFPILDTETAKQIDCEAGSPIVIFLACSTGAADHQHDCLAETMIRQPRGPIAAICGSRVTMPYAMSLLSVEMIEEFFKGDATTLGELTMLAKQRMVRQEKNSDNPHSDNPHSDNPHSDNPYRDMIHGMGKLFSPRPELLAAECLEHAQLIHLFGDPLLRLQRPGLIDVSTAAVANSGEALRVKGNSPAVGEMTVELVYRRDRFRQRPPHRKGYDSSDVSFRSYQDVYENSHRLVCDSKTLSVQQGSFEIDLEIPGDAGGSCVVRCMLQSDEGFALGSTEIAIRKTNLIRAAKK